MPDPTRRQRLARKLRQRRERVGRLLRAHVGGASRVAMFLIGVAAMTRGLALWSVPVAWCFAGASIVLVALLLEREAMAKKRPKEVT